MDGAQEKENEKAHQQEEKQDSFLLHRKRIFQQEQQERLRRISRRIECKEKKGHVAER